MDEFSRIQPMTDGELAAAPHARHLACYVRHPYAEDDLAFEEDRSTTIAS